MNNFAQRLLNCVYVQRLILTTLDQPKLQFALLWMSTYSLEYSDSSAFRRIWFVILIEARRLNILATREEAQEISNLIQAFDLTNTLPWTVPDDNI